MIDLNNALDFGKKICISAGSELIKLFLSHEDLDINIKSKNQIVTKADTVAEKHLTAEIHKKYPDHSILSEEEGSYMTDSDYKWIIDPLDGTTNFSIRVPFYNTTLALTHKDEIILGVVFAPFHEGLYWGSKIHGAFMGDQELKVSNNTKMEESFHAFCYGDNLENATDIAAEYYKMNLRKGYKTRQLGSAALELSMLAQGVIESMVIPGAKIWDVAAGVFLVREAGGIVKGWDGEEFGISSKGLIAANNEEIYEEVKKGIEEIKL